MSSIAVSDTHFDRPSASSGSTGSTGSTGSSTLRNADVQTKHRSSIRRWLHSVRKALLSKSLRKHLEISSDKEPQLHQIILSPAASDQHATDIEPAHEIQPAPTSNLATHTQETFSIPPSAPASVAPSAPASVAASAPSSSKSDWWVIDDEPAAAGPSSSSTTDWWALDDESAAAGPSSSSCSASILTNSSSIFTNNTMSAKPAKAKRSRKPRGPIMITPTMLDRLTKDNKKHQGAAAAREAEVWKNSRGGSSSTPRVNGVQASPMRWSQD